MKAIKCEQCGSTKCKKLPNGQYQCEYCGTIMKEESFIDEKVLEKIQTAVESKKNVSFLKPAYTKDEYKKQCLLLLGSDKRTPTDILTASTFEDVKISYKYFVNVDTDFNIISVNQPSKNNDDDKPSKIGQNLLISVSDEIEEKDLQFASDNLDDMLVEGQKDIWSNVKKNEVNMPTQDYIQERINYCIEDYKSKLIEKYTYATKVTHKIIKVDFYAVPYYSLDYTYGGKKFNISSFANNLALPKEIPTISGKTKRSNFLKVNIPYMVSVALCMALIIFTSICMSSRKLQLATPILIFTIITAVVSVLSIIYAKFAKLKIKQMTFKKKISNLKSYFKQSNIELTARELERVEKEGVNE